MVDQEEEGRALKMKEQKDAAKEALNAAAFAQFLPGPAWEANRSGSFAA